MNQGFLASLFLFFRFSSTLKKNNRHKNLLRSSTMRLLAYAHHPGHGNLGSEPAPRKSVSPLCDYRINKSLKQETARGLAAWYSGQSCLHDTSQSAGSNTGSSPSTQLPTYVLRKAEQGSPWISVQVRCLLLDLHSSFTLAQTPRGSGDGRVSPCLLPWDPSLTWVWVGIWRTNQMALLCVCPLLLKN